MADYWISFRIEYDTPASYQRRYDALDEGLRECATDGMWVSDTSFTAIGSHLNIDTIGQRLKRALNVTTDRLVIRQIDFINTRYINDPGVGFLGFFPKAIKL
jgi:hypothetical protein